MKPNNILVTHPIPDIGIRLLRGQGYDVTVLQDRHAHPPEVLKEQVRDCDALLTLLIDRVDAPLLAAAPDLKIVANHAVGYDNVDIEAAKKHGVRVTNTPGVLTHATAEIAFALLISLTRRIIEADRYTRAGKFTVWDPLLLRGDELRGKTMGIIGMGRIGREVARKCRAFDMKICYHNRKPVKPEIADPLGATWCPLDELLARSHVISIHTPLTPETYHLIDGRAFDKMRQGVYLINTARGEVVDEAALVNALRSGKLKGAGLDVYEFEPEVTPALLDMENVILLPHIGSATMEARDGMAETAAQNIIAVLEGESPPNLIPELRG